MTPDPGADVVGKDLCGVSPPPPVSARGVDPSSCPCPTSPSPLMGISPGLDQRMFPGPRRPRSEWGSVLRGLPDHLRERVNRRVQAEEAFEHRGEKERTGADVFFLVELDGDFRAAAETA